MTHVSHHLARSARSSGGSSVAHITLVRKEREGDLKRTVECRLIYFRYSDCGYLNRILSYRISFIPFNSQQAIQTSKTLKLQNPPNTTH